MKLTVKYDKEKWKMIPWHVFSRDFGNWLMLHLLFKITSNVEQIKSMKKNLWNTLGEMPAKNP